MEEVLEGSDLVVVGLGYVGLPLAAEATRAGLRVVGFDIHPGLVKNLSAGISHIDDVPDAEIAGLLERGFTATCDEEVLGRADTIVICVPTPLTESGGPDLEAVNAALAAVRRHLHRGQLIVLESTTYPGTTDEVARPLLETSGLMVGPDIHLAFSPERIDPGNAKFGVKNTPKVVGGCTPGCTEAAVAFYARFIDIVVPAKGAREAEMAKLLENTYRHVNIALVNELAQLCHGLDIDLWNVINLAATKPFGFQAFRPGPGVGGHCIPVDPMYLAFKVRQDLGEAAHFIELAQQINNGMPAYVANRCTELLEKHGKALEGARVLILGVTYKPDIADTRETPAKALVQELADRGALVSFHDPYVSNWSVPGLVSHTPVPDLVEAMTESDLVVLVQNHKAYELATVKRESSLVFDTRGVVPVGEGVEYL